jgi:MoxR-like ATPase
MQRRESRPVEQSEAQAKASALVANIETVIKGKRRTVELAVIALLCGGQLLVEDVPGVGKTVLARALARSIEGTFHRIQFTPDLLPSDVTGVSVYNQKTSEFEFQPGPVFANVVLIDEINRTTPRTQSSLLEAMEEHQVTVDGHTMLLPDPFFVIATQNPIEFYGTYPLP